MLQLIQASKIFNRGKPTQTNALRDVHIEVHSGDFIVIVGANGSGKSTLLNSISGSISLDSGEIWLNKKNITSLPDYQRSRWIARVFQNPLQGTAPNLSILDNFRLAAIRTGKKKLHIGTTPAFKRLVQDRIEALQMGLEDKVEQPMGTLSGGQRQALTLLMTVMADLDLLLLDEPTAALDPRSAKMVMDITQKLIRQYNLTALLITHNLSEALQYGNCLIQMQEGMIVRQLDTTAKQRLSPTDILQWFDYSI